MSSLAYIPLADLPASMEIQPGDSLMVASDLTRLAVSVIRKEGKFDPNVLIDSLLARLGPGGTLIIPAYNFNLKEGDKFHPQKSVPITGALAEAALKRTDFLRTRHPLHSFLVSGKYARELSELNNTGSFGPDSPFHFFKEKNALMLMIGTNVEEAFTFVHHVEEMEKVKYRHHKEIGINYIDDNGTGSMKAFSIYAKKAGWTMNLASLEELFRGKGILKESIFNGVSCQMVRLDEAYPIIKDDIFFNKAGSISHFSFKLMMKEYMKNALSALHLYKTPTEKISRAAGPR